MTDERWIITALAGWVAAQWVVIGLLYRRVRADRRHVRIALGIAAAATRQLHDYEEDTPVMAWFDGEEDVVTTPVRSVRYWLN